MKQHLDEKQIERYRNQALSPEELESFDQHVAECEPCRTQAAAATQALNRVALLRAELEQPQEEHLSYEQIERYAEDTLTKSEADEIRNHLNTCEECRTSAMDLQRLRQDLASQRRIQWMKTVTAAAACIALISTLALYPLWNARARLREQNAQLQQEVLSARSSLQANQSGIGSQPPGLQIQEGKARILVNREGNITVVQPQGAEHQKMLAEALTAGRLSIPDLSPLKGTSGQLLGPADQAPFSLLSPVATNVETDQPEFRWTQMSGAENYVISVFDTDFNLIDKSNPLKANTWRLTVTLKRGKTYAWQVVATAPGGQFKSPMPPQPPAQFRVLAEDAVEMLESARSGIGSHLLRGILAAHYGLLDDAEIELKLAANQQPSPPQASVFLQQIRDSRKK